MDKYNKCYGIIPARYESTRFPGKPLADIAGKPMFWHVFNNAKKCRELSMVVLATDDKRIVSAAKALDVPVVETRTDHPSGTDRVLEAAQLLNLSDDSIIVNIQGDEPLLNPAMLTQIVKPFTSAKVLVTTLARNITKNEAGNINQVKVVFSKTGNALYFSRMAIPCYRDVEDGGFFGHIGLYAFRMSALEKFVSLGPSRLEVAEKLEQLRLLENNIPVHVVLTEHESIGVDRPEDIKMILEILNRRKDKRNI
ncbi:MAG: 3-deoxy-manno-octulosonate cytidylyltransferase [Proteobacteria bacterium]|nr:3-deoxy-manno-octulosonate cytidylyltransferase [Pseudomonadota bacterium]MBU4009347.1 3-deoxy-manno-octulosonate cytidylyltransferase [Pseudomonadota bacterium]